MPTVINCANCNHQISIEAPQSVLMGKCPKCSSVLQITPTSNRSQLNVSVVPAGAVGQKQIQPPARRPNLDQQSAVSRPIASDGQSDLGDWLMSELKTNQSEMPTAAQLGETTSPSPQDVGNMWQKHIQKIQQDDEEKEADQSLAETYLQSIMAILLEVVYMLILSIGAWVAFGFLGGLIMLGIAAYHFTNSDVVRASICGFIAVIIAAVGWWKWPALIYFQNATGLEPIDF